MQRRGKTCACMRAAKINFRKRRNIVQMSILAASNLQSCCFSNKAHFCAAHNCCGAMIGAIELKFAKLRFVL
jgi:hypothetical protein